MFTQCGPSGVQNVITRQPFRITDEYGIQLTIWLANGYAFAVVYLEDPKEKTILGYIRPSLN